MSTITALEKFERDIDIYGENGLKELEYCLKNPQYDYRVPLIREFITSPYYLGREDAWESIIKDLEDFYEGDREYKEAVFCEAIGAGKSFKSSVIVSYEVMKVLALHNPQKLFGLASGSEIDFVNTSTNSDQARRIVFGQIKNRVDESYWFQTFFPPNPKIRSELKFPQKNINIVPGNSTDTFALGMNVFAGVIDEASFYKVTDRKDYAEDVYDSINRRIRSRGNNIFKNYGKVIVISSPRYKNDFIERKMAEKEPHIFKRRKMLWESAPAKNFSGKTFKYKRWQIPIEFKTDFTKNPEKSERDLMAMPSSALEPYLKNTDKLERCINKTKKNPEEEQKVARNFWNRKYREYYVHVDLALKKDACGLAMGHLEKGNRAVIDIIMRVTARPKEEIEFESIRELIYELSRRKFKIAKVSYDGWQSVDSRQILRSKGYSVSLLSVDRNLEAYDQFKSFVYLDKLSVPYCDYKELESRNPRTPVEWFFREAENLELIKGKKVDHPPAGSKDVTDAVAGVCYWLGKNSSEGEISLPSSDPGKNKPTALPPPKPEEKKSTSTGSLPVSGR